MKTIDRRQFNKLFGAGLATIPLAALAASLPSHAADTPMVDPESATAKALQYMAMSETDGANCAGCMLYTGEEGAEAGPCSVFPGAHVAAAGWCSAYVAKPS